MIVFIPVIVAGGIFIEVLTSLMAAVGVYELFKMRNLDIRSAEGALAILGSVFLVFPVKKYLTFLPTDANWVLFFLVVLGFLAMVVISKNEYTFEEAGFPILTSLYVGCGFQYLVQARGKSLLALLFALFIVWATDIGAYMIGRQYGSRKLAPSISPNKTIEGSLGGVVCAVVVALIFLLIYPAKEVFDKSLPIMLLFTAIFSMFGQFGDLVESAIKRFYGVKDSGNILPGHGGILDRFDSLLFVFPVMHLFGLF